MCAAYLRAHVFVSCSTVENESNSLSEAKVLGMPTVASFVGGVVDRVTHGHSGYAYPADAPYLLAHFVGEIFDNDDMAIRMGQAAQAEARVVNDRMVNHSTLLEVYASVLEHQEDERSAREAF